MTRRSLFLTIGAAVLVVAVLAVLTPTVIVRDEGPGGVRMVGFVKPQLPGGIPSAPAPRGRQQLPGLQPGPLPGLRSCLQKQGLGRNRGAPPDLRTMRDALEACARQLPGTPFRRLP